MSGIKFDTVFAMKDTVFLGTSLDDLRAFPKSVQRKVGYQIYRVEAGLNPDDWKPMPSIGAGVREIRIRDEGNAYRSIYITSIDQTVYVLHVFQKKTQRTAKKDIALAKARLGALR